MRSWPGWNRCPSTWPSRWSRSTGRHRRAAAATSCVLDALEAAAQRPAALRLLDRRREIDPAWFQRSRMIGYVCYADRFAGSLPGVRQHLDYLAELGVSYLHLMPLLRPQGRGERRRLRGRRLRCGGPAARQHGRPEALAADLHERGIALCVDLVLNHTAREHEWARKALAGEPDCPGDVPDLPGPHRAGRLRGHAAGRVPGQCAGQLLRGQGLGWVWTTFHDFQWDLNYANPAVFRAMLGIMLSLANRGIDVLRLDAAPFLWKRLGTDCQNQPEAHLLVQAFRALTRLAAPGLLLKAEAIVSPDMLVAYLGGHDRYRPECDLAYDNQLMVMLWSSLATRDVRLAEQALGRRRPAPAPTAWVCYLRCHDDIGWAVSDEDAAAAGLGGFPHRRFLNDFYAGLFPGSFARGALFQDNPATGDARISGMAASLCGTPGPGGRDEHELTLAIRRLESMYAVVFSFGGIPLLYMGDEIALPNDPCWAADPGTRRTTGGCTGRPWTGRRPGGGTTRAAWKAACSPRCAGSVWPGGAAGAALRRHHRDPAHREPARAGLPPGAPAQRPVPVADEFQRCGAVRGRGHHGPGRAVRPAPRARDHGGRAGQRAPDRGARLGLRLVHRVAESRLLDDVAGGLEDGQAAQDRRRITRPAEGGEVVPAAPPHPPAQRLEPGGGELEARLAGRAGQELRVLDHDAQRHRERSPASSQPGERAEPRAPAGRGPRGCRARG